jgi:hypothetical protein
MKSFLNYCVYNPLILLMLCLSIVNYQTHAAVNPTQQPSIISQFILRYQRNKDSTDLNPDEVVRTVHSRAENMIYHYYEIIYKFLIIEIINVSSLVAIIYPICFNNHSLCISYLWVLYGCHCKQRLFP